MRVEGGRVADGGEEGDVLVAVAVGIGVGEVERVLAGEGSYAAGLVPAPQHRSVGGAGELAVLDDELGADEVLDAEVAGDRGDLVLRGGGGDRDRVPGALVGLDERARLTADGAGDLGAEQPVAEVGERLLGLPAHRGEGDVRDPGRVAAELAVDRRDDRPEELGG